MRDALFFLSFLPMPVAAVLYPWCGLLLWCWIAFVSPQRDLWGFAAGIPYNQIIAIATLAGWLLSRERKFLPVDLTTALLLGLFLVLVVSTAASLAPAPSIEHFERYAKHWILLLLIPLFLTTAVRVHAFIWLMAFCIGYYGVEGGGLFLLSGGRHAMTGPAQTQIGDNNHLALAMVTAMPLMNYLRLQTAQWWIRLGLAGAMALTTLAVIGTQSRGGFIALCVMTVMLLWRSKGRLMLLASAGLVAAVVYQLASTQWVERIETIETAHEEDQSFRGRLLAWQVYAHAGLQRPLTGAGLKALEQPEVYFRFMPDRLFFDLDVEEAEARAAHSVYFQLLGEAGLLALILYLMLLATAWRNASWVRRHAGSADDKAWMADLARMGQVSIAAFSVGGAALSMAFYDYFLALLVVMAVLRRLLKQEQAGEAPVPMRPRGGSLRKAGAT